jgi:hypothetical protein
MRFNEPVATNLNMLDAVVDFLEASRVDFPKNCYDMKRSISVGFEYGF